MILTSVFKSLGYVGTVHVIRTVLSLVIGIHVISHLGPEAYGKLSVAMALAMILGMPNSLAPNSLVVRELANRAVGDAATVIRTALAIKLAAAAVHVVLALGAIALLRHGTEISLAVVLIAAGSFGSAFGVTGSALELDGRFDTLSLISLAGTLLSVVLRLALLLADAGLLWFAAAILIDALVLAAINLYAYRDARHLLQRKSLDIKLARTLLTDSWPLALAAFLISLYTRTDVMFIAYFLGEEAAGNYAAAVRLTECWYFIPSALAAVAYPRLVKHRREEPERFYDLLTMSCGAGFWVTVFMALGITVASPYLLPWLLGPAYIASIPTLQITAWGLIFLPLSGATSSWLLIGSMPRVMLYASFGTALVSVAVNLLLVPTLGIAGAAVALLISQAVYCVLLLLIVGDKRATAALLRGMSPTTLVRLMRFCIDRARGISAA